MKLNIILFINEFQVFDWSLSDLAQSKFLKIYENWFTFNFSTKFNLNIIIGLYICMYVYIIHITDTIIKFKVNLDNKLNVNQFL